MSEEKYIKEEELEKVAGGFPKREPHEPEPREPYGFAVGTIRRFKGLNMNFHETWDYIDKYWDEFLQDMSLLGFRQCSKEELYELFVELWPITDYQ